VRNPYDFYETPEHYVDALNDTYIFSGSVFDPCVGDGNIIKWIDKTLITQITTNDLDPTKVADMHQNAAWFKNWSDTNYDWWITNPPNDDVIPIIENAWRYSKQGFAMAVRLSMLEPANNRVSLLKSLQDHITHLTILPRYSFKQNKSTDTVTYCWIIVRHGWNEKCKIRFVGR
jgi:hypothetical protein